MDIAWLMLGPNSKDPAISIDKYSANAIIYIKMVNVV